MSRLETLGIRDAEYVDDKDGVSVLHVYDPHALSQAAGYLKHTCAHVSQEHVVFRGQTRLYGSLTPSLFRGLNRAKTCGKRIGELNRRIQQVVKVNRIFRKFNSVFHEPLLQHYGFRTTWIDLVDNIWIALWFACHEAKSAGRDGEYVHFEQRKAIHWKDFVYILLIGADFATRRSTVPGFTAGATTELVDLRIGAPSIFLRPHSQHGVLFRMKGHKVARPMDYSSQVRGIVRVYLTDALEWVGGGALLGVHALFPPPSYDVGYGYLLESADGHSKVVGGISHIGA